MSEEANRHPVLETAWKRYAQLDANAAAIQKYHMKIRGWIIALGITATLLAIITNKYGATVPKGVALALKIALILTPIVGSGIAAFGDRFQYSQRWLSFRAGAEEVLKEIYIFRTVMQDSPDRYKWLNTRLAEIQRQLYKSVGGEMVLKPYTGQLPPYYDSKSEDSDPGFTDLTGDEYLNYRLNDQFAWHDKKLVNLQRDRKIFQVLILSMGGAGALIAALESTFGGIAVWVALTAAITTALVSWQELRGLDLKVNNFSRVVLELSIIRNHWMSLSRDERTKTTFYKVVRATEDLLWSQNVEYVSTMREAIANVEGDEADLVEEMVRKSKETSEHIQAKMIHASQDVMDEAITQIERVTDDAAETVKGMMVSVADEAEAFIDTAGHALDTAIDEVDAYRETFDSTASEALDDAAAMREHFEATTEGILEASNEIQDTFTSIDSAVDAALAESAALSATIQSAAKTVSNLTDAIADPADYPEWDEDDGDPELSADDDGEPDPADYPEWDEDADDPELDKDDDGEPNPADYPEWDEDADDPELTDDNKDNASASSFPDWLNDDPA